MPDISSPTLPEVGQSSVLTGDPRHVTGDRLLSILSGAEGLVGSLVAAFPGANRATATQWLDDWFLSLALAIHNGEATLPCEPVSPELLAELSAGCDARCSLPFRIMAIEPHFFRGFRELSEPITLDADLVVVEGRNSHGKTSIAEALEWLFTGVLSRRDSGAQGNARELESCVGNYFRPDGESTWVEARLRLDGDVSTILKRVLIEDYGNTATSRCTSRLERDGAPLALGDERRLLDALLAGCPPLLMQHTLGQFIHSGPATRRQYFERLLQLEELTDLIERAVMGTRLGTLPAPTGGVGRARWEALRTTLKVNASKARMRAAEQAAPAEWPTAIPAEMAKIAALEFSALVPRAASFEDAVAAITAAQREERRRNFPLLSVLRSRRGVDAAAEELLSARRLLEAEHVVAERVAAVDTARTAASAITQAERAIAEAVGILERSGLIPDAPDGPLTCPVCIHRDAPTLTPSRIKEIRAWEPATAAVGQAERQLAKATTALAAHVQELVQARRAVIPRQPSDDDWAAALKDVQPQVGTAAEAFREAANKLEQNLRTFDEGAVAFERALKTSPTPDAAGLQGVVATIVPTLGAVLAAGREYAALLKGFEDAVGSQTTEGGAYTQRERWLDAAGDPLAIAGDFAWGRAIKSAQDQLAATRSCLMDARQMLLDRHRQELTDGFKAVWGTLRSDRYSAFHQLTIPQPAGKGFRVEIQVKARLDDGATVAEIDALRVFSESQVNVLGIAAFVTRAKLLGHRVLVFDDPVQSMDEDHFKTFSGRLVPSLIDEGFQVVLLTHNDTFAREVSYAHAERESYATVTISHGRKTGCRVDRDNRRFSERVRRAQNAVDDGDLSEGWKVLRLAIERLYFVTYIKHGPKSFKPVSWIEQTAESMFNQGVGPIVEAHAPAMGPRLREILRMAAAGAHDKAAHGETDFALAVADLQTLKGKLSLVD